MTPQQMEKLLLDVIASIAEAMNAIKGKQESESWEAALDWVDAAIGDAKNVLKAIEQKLEEELKGAKS